MKIRHLKDTDIEDLLGLCNRNLHYDQMTPELLEEKVWEDKDFENDLALVVEHENNLVAFIMGLVRKNADEPLGYVKLIVVEEKYQRKGVGRRLLQAVEPMLLERGAKRVRVCESAPNYLTPGIDARYTRAMVFFEKNGYERFGETWNMEADLSREDFDTTAEEQKLKQQGIEIRRAIMGDLEDISRFLQQHWPAWIEEVQRSLLNYPISLHLALSEGKIIAFSGYDCNNFNTGWFGPMGTDPQYRGLGIGGVLLRRCLADIKKQGHRFATIPWVGPIAFYLHYAGAEISRVFYRYQKHLA
ncbi:MAG: GNAT family N-acetyltransferase [Calditrichaeota bacterium]|nr:MAG: GNAT family N-acetyltransferase [Calditrichota bacterium]